LLIAGNYLIMCDTNSKGEIKVNKQHNEVEVKYDVSDSYFEILERIRKLGAIFQGGCVETTCRFDTNDKQLEANNIFLRVRRGFKNTITLKEKRKEDVGVKSRLETEFEIEDIEQMEYILSKIGFKYIRKMEKYRMTWLYNNAVITIDELPFGIYLEIEAAESVIAHLASILGIAEQFKIVHTYWDILTQINAENNTYLENIVFPDNYIYKLSKC